MTVWILSAQEFYAGVADYMHRVDPSWDDERWQAQMAAGFQQVEPLPQPSPWHPYEVVASKAGW